MRTKKFTALYVVCWKSHETGNMGHNVTSWNIGDALDIVRQRNSEPDRKFDWWFEPSVNVINREHYSEYERQVAVYKKYPLTTV